MAESLTPLCEHVNVRRHHCGGGGMGSPWDCAELVVQDGGAWRVVSMMSPPPPPAGLRLEGEIRWLCDHVGLLVARVMGGPDTLWMVIERKPTDPSCAFLSVTSRAPSREEFLAMTHVVLLAGFSKKRYERHGGHPDKVIYKTI